MASFVGRQSNPTTTCAAPASRCNSYQPHSENETALGHRPIELEATRSFEHSGWYPYLSNHPSAFSLLLGPRLRTWKGPSNVPQSCSQTSPGLCHPRRGVVTPPRKSTGPSAGGLGRGLPQGEQDRLRPHLCREG